MKQNFILLFFILSLILFGSTKASAYDQYESMKVGETTTFYFPSEVTSRASSIYASNCYSDHVNNVEVVSFTNTSVTLKALEYTKYTVNIVFDYWWIENDYGRNDTHMIHIDLYESGGGGGGNTANKNENPSNYTFDKGCWGTIDIYEGESKTVYNQYDVSNPDKVKSVVWSLYGSYGYDITSQSSSSCVIKGSFKCSKQELWCLMKYGNTSYKAYYLVNVKEKNADNNEENVDENAKTININSENFPDESFRNYLLSRSYGNDKIITKEEFRKITSMNLSGSNEERGTIKSLKGIEYFTALEFLNCGYNQLTSLDVSKNIKLRNLYCYKNQLTSLDVSNNTKLENLSCSSNQLTSLDVSKNTALVDLTCSSNQLTSLNVSNNTALELLKCSLNKIKGAEMNNLIESLHDNTSGKECDFDVINMVNANEENVCTKKQVAAAKAKGWSTKCWDGDSWTNYEGSDEASNIGGVTINEKKDTRIFNLFGRQLDKPQKGINIINGKKHIMK